MENKKSEVEPKMFYNNFNYIVYKNLFTIYIIHISYTYYVYDMCMI